MAEENGTLINNQGVPPEPSPQLAATLSPDDIPIGGSKFNFS